MARKLRGATAVVGIGQTPWYPRGGSPYSEHKLALQAIVAAAEDAGIDPRDIDGFVSYAGERNSGPRLMAALGTRELRYSALVWTHGGGIPGAVGLAAAGIVSGRADIVVVVRAMSEKAGERRLASMSRAIEAGRTGRGAHGVSSQEMVNGVDERLTGFAMSATRLMEADGVPREALRALSLASYYHGQRNPRAYAHSTVLDEEAYEASRWVAEPLHVFDFSRQNDAGAAVILVSAERAKEFKHKPAYVLSAPMGRFGGEGYGRTGRDREGGRTAGFQSVARRLWAESGYGPADVDVAQIYTNSTAAAVNTIIDHGFCPIRTPANSCVLRT